MQTKQLKAIDLIFDWNLWPRHEANDLDSTNLRRMKQALRAGIKLPPIIVNKQDNRIVDGFHRTKAILSVFGDGALIDAEVKSFKNDAEIFVETIRINSQHGLPLSPLDKIHATHKARKLKIPYGLISKLFGVTDDELKKFIKKRTAKNKDGENIALPGGALNLAGKTLTSDQEKYVKGINGMKAASNASILLNELKSGAFIINEKFKKTLIELRDKIDDILAEANDE